MNKEQALQHLEKMTIDVKRQSNLRDFEWYRGRADGFILSLMYQGVITHHEYGDLADSLLQIRLSSAE